jgi:hypothetical protein
LLLAWSVLESRDAVSLVAQDKHVLLDDVRNWDRVLFFILLAERTAVLLDCTRLHFSQLDHRHHYRQDQGDISESSLTLSIRYIKSISEVSVKYLVLHLLCILFYWIRPQNGFCVANARRGLRAFIARRQIFHRAC